MQPIDLESLIALRLAVASLGEAGWWPSRFLSAQSRPFLAPVFGRTLTLAQWSGAVQAAALVHDARIGVGRVVHLFRLPEELEQGMHQALRTPPIQAHVAPLLASPEAALAYLRREGGSAPGGGVGPTRVEGGASLRDRRVWRVVAAHYAHAFATQTQVFPYLPREL